MRFLRLQTLRAQALLGMAVLVALVLLGAGATVTSEVALTHAAADADRQRQAQVDQAAFLTGMLNEETGVRGFVNTGDRQFLQPYELGQTQVTQAKAHLLADEDPQDQVLLRREEDAASAWQAWAATRVAAVIAAGTPLLDQDQSARGKQLFDAFRSAAQAMGAHIDAGLASAQAQSRLQTSILLVATISAALLIVAVLAFLGLLVFRSTLGPLGSLFAAASSLAAGEQAEVPVLRSNNEVGQLARALAAWKRTELERLTVVQTANELSSQVELQAIFDLGSQRLGEMLDCPHVTVSLPDRLGLHVLVSRGPAAPPTGQMLPIETPGARAFRTRQTVVSDLRSPGWGEEVVRWRDVHSAGPVLSVPLVSGGDLLGVVTCTRLADQAPFTNADRDRAELFAPSLASAIRVSQLFQNLRETSANLELANRHKSVFLANMSHELRTPLNAILGFSQLLIDDPSGRIDEKTRVRFLNQINSSGQHLLALINDILDLSKVEAGQVELHLATTMVAEVIDAVVTTVEPLAANKGIKVVSEAGRDLYLVADPGKLKQMLLNLVSNSIKFTPSGGRVTIAARRDESTVEMSVTDTGIGMSEDDLKIIFQEFRQLDQGPDRQQEGTGLGLALTRRFAELHGGSVTVQSSKGKGSTFTLRLPVEPPSPKTEPALQPTPVGSTDSSRPLVLVVEDDPQAAELLARHLDAGGFRFELARTGNEALSKARDLKPAAITLDILLPEVDGWEVITRLKQEDGTRDIPVVVVSVVDNPGLGRALGALDYFVKPVDRDALLSRLGRYTFTSKVEREEIRILLVDDEAANLEYLESVLKPAGFTVLRASGGREGIEMARADKPHLVLLDLMMPEVTGFDVVEALRRDESTRSIPIMVLTAMQLSDEDKKQLNSYVAGVFERNSLAGPELIGWLHQLVGV